MTTPQSQIRPRISERVKYEIPLNEHNSTVITKRAIHLTESIQIHLNREVFIKHGHLFNFYPGKLKMN